MDDCCHCENEQGPDPPTKKAVNWGLRLFSNVPTPISQHLCHSHQRSVPPVTIVVVFVVVLVVEVV